LFLNFYSINEIFKIQKFPSVFQSSNCPNSSNSNYNCPKLLSFTLRYCTLSNGTQLSGCNSIINSLSSTVSSDGSCTNLVKEIRYILSYQNPTGLISAYVDVVFFNDAQTKSASFKPNQYFSVIFVPSTVSFVKKLNFSL